MIKRRALFTVVFSLFILVAGLVFSWFHFLHSSNVSSPNGIAFTVHEGASFESVIVELHKQKIIKHPLLFKLLVLTRGEIHKLKSGEYLFQQNTTPPKMIDQMVTGTGLVMHSITIVSGWNFKQVREGLDTDANLNHKTSHLSDTEIMDKLGHTELKPEGQFFPDTYSFTKGTSDLKLLKLAFKSMQDKLTAAWQQRIKTLPYKDKYEMLIAASLIEKEARYDIERPIISGVIINRINKKMLLQIDPTVIYGLGSRYNGTIYKKDLLEDTPYNTYVHKGLPPTPISMPSLESIIAAARPETNNYLYYVARGDGYHQFSKSLQEHNKAVTEAKKIHAAFYNHNLMKTYYIRQLSSI